MSKKFLLVTLTAFSLVGLEGSEHNALSEKNKTNTVSQESKKRPVGDRLCWSQSVYMDTWCDLRVKYFDCDGNPQSNVMLSSGEKSYNVSDPSMSFECAGGSAPTQTLYFKDRYTYADQAYCSGHTWDISCDWQ